VDLVGGLEHDLNAQAQVPESRLARGKVAIERG
jgi:hypothetical protein